MARALLDRAEKTTRHGEKLLAKARTRVESFGDIEGEIAEARAVQIKAGKNGPINLALAAKLKAKLEAVNIAGLDERAQALIAGELADAQQALASAGWRVESAVEAVVVAEAEKIVGEVWALERRALELRRRLEASAALWVATPTGRPRPLETSPKMRIALDSGPLNAGASPLPPGTAGEAVAVWASFAEKLKSDSNATVAQ